MPLLPEEQIAQAVKATKELRETIRDAHEARKTLRQVMKEQRSAIVEAIEEAVSVHVDRVGEDAKQLMVDRVGEVIDRIEADWRRSLHLDG